MLNWQKIVPHGRDIEAQTEFGTYTISIDSPLVGGTCYLWTPEQGIDDDYSSAYDYLTEAKQAAEEHYKKLKD